MRIFFRLLNISFTRKNKRRFEIVIYLTLINLYPGVEKIDIERAQGSYVAENVK